MFYFYLYKMTTFDEKILNIVKSIIEKDGAEPEPEPEKSIHPLAGKYVSILGDGQSTFKNWILDPEDTAPAYHYGPSETSNDVVVVNDTWWHKLLSSCGAKLCVNNSIKYTGVRTDFEDEPLYSNADQRVNRYGLSRHAGFTYKNLEGDDEPGEDIKPDIIIIFTGMYDWKSDVPLGIPEKGVQSLDITTCDQQPANTFARGFNEVIKSSYSKYKDAQIYVITPYIGDENKIVRHVDPENPDLLEPLADMYAIMERITSLYTNVKFIPLHKLIGRSTSKLPFVNGDYFTKAGMDKMAEVVKRFIENN